MMIEQPQVVVRVTAASEFLIAGPASERIGNVASRLVESELLRTRPNCIVEIVASSVPHIGLGSGTQVALAAATAMLRFASDPECSGRESDISTISAAIGRGRRSAIGTHGFAHGGLLVDTGKEPAVEVAPLIDRVSLPESWRVLLLIPDEDNRQGIHGGDEIAAFDRLAAVPRDATKLMRSIAIDRMLPAAKSGRFDEFSNAVYDLNRRSGECYARVQSGPYASPRAERWIEKLQTRGARGAGQSSWGPTLFAVCRDENSADKIRATIEEEARGDGWRVLVTKPANSGAIVECTP